MRRLLTRSRWHRCSSRAPLPRAQLALNDGHRVWSQITRDDLDRLGLRQQQRVYVEPRRARVFAEGAETHG